MKLPYSIIRRHWMPSVIVALLFVFMGENVLAKKIPVPGEYTTYQDEVVPAMFFISRRHSPHVYTALWQGVKCKASGSSKAVLKPFQAKSLWFVHNGDTVRFRSIDAQGFNRAYKSRYVFMWEAITGNTSFLLGKVKHYTSAFAGPVQSASITGAGAMVVSTFRVVEDESGELYFLDPLFTEDEVFFEVFPHCPEVQKLVENRANYIKQGAVAGMYPHMGGMLTQQTLYAGFSISQLVNIYNEDCSSSPKRVKQDKPKTPKTKIDDGSPVGPDDFQR